MFGKTKESLTYQQFPNNWHFLAGPQCRTDLAGGLGAYQGRTQLTPNPLDAVTANLTMPSYHNHTLKRTFLC